MDNYFWWLLQLLYRMEVNTIYHYITYKCSGQKAYEKIIYGNWVTLYGLSFLDLRN